MTRELEPLASGDPNVKAVVESLSRGEVLVIPTDTVYGLCCDPTDQAAVDRIFDLKGRDVSVPLSVLISDALDATSLVSGVEFDLNQFDDPEWPGALTLVLEMSGTPLAVGVGSTASTLGLRRPGTGFVANVIAEFGPIAATSANRHGAQPIGNAGELAQRLGPGVDAYVEVGEIAVHGSTVVEVLGDGWRQLRPGPVATDILVRFLGQESTAK